MALHAEAEESLHRSFDTEPKLTESARGRALADCTDFTDNLINVSRAIQ